MLRSILLPQRSVTFDIQTPVNSGKYMACVFYSVYLNNLFAFISIVESIIDTLTRRSYFTCEEDKNDHHFIHTETMTYITYM